MNPALLFQLRWHDFHQYDIYLATIPCINPAFVLVKVASFSSMRLSISVIDRPAVVFNINPASTCTLLVFNLMVLKSPGTQTEGAQKSNAQQKHQ